MTKYMLVTVFVVKELTKNIKNSLKNAKQGSLMYEHHRKSKKNKRKR